MLAGQPQKQPRRQRQTFPADRFLIAPSAGYPAAKRRQPAEAAGAADEGETAEGYRFERLALYADSSYALVNVNPATREAWFRLYGEQQIRAPSGAGEAVPLSHSVARVRLF